MSHYISLFLYYAVLKHLPNATMPVVGHFCRNLRAIACRHIFKKCGKHIDIARGVYFGNGSQIELSDNSGLGPNCRIVGTDLRVGEYVMMGPDVLIQGGGTQA